MGKRRRPKQQDFSKRAKIENEIDDSVCGQGTGESCPELTSMRIDPEDKVESKVDVIIKDFKKNSYNSLSIWGAGLGVEKTIAVVEELKRNYLKKCIKYSQETSIKVGENNEPRLQIVISLLNSDGDNDKNGNSESYGK